MLIIECSHNNIVFLKLEHSVWFGLLAVDLLGMEELVQHVLGLDTQLTDGAHGTNMLVMTMLFTTYDGMDGCSSLLTAWVGIPIPQLAW